MQTNFSRWLCVASVTFAVACGDDDHSSKPKVSAQRSGTGGASESAGASAGEGGAGGTAGRRANSPLNCPARAPSEVKCGGQTCPTEYPMQSSPCFEPCCVTFEGREQCGLRGTSSAFRTECVLPGTPDDSCDEVVQFQGCCDLTQHRCGIIGGFAPGCQTKSSFVTLPTNPKSCGHDDDAGASDGGN